MPLSTSDVRFYLSTPTAQLTPAQRAVQTMIFAADQGVAAKKVVYPANIRPDAVKKPVDRKAAALKARDTMRANARAAIAALREAEAAEADLDVTEGEADAPDA
jgi:hypothetical protein